MKKIFALLTAAALTLFLCACARSGTPVAAAEPTNPLESPTPPSALPTDSPPSPSAQIVPAATEKAPSAEVQSLLALLRGVAEEYELGTAGSSLKAVRHAGMLLDWNEASEIPGAALEGAQRFKASYDLSSDADFTQKLTGLAALSVYLCFEANRGMLDDAGYQPLSRSWTPREASALFDTLFQGLGIDAPPAVMLCYADEGAAGFLSASVPVRELTPAAAWQALRSAGIVSGEAELLSSSQTVEGLTLDFNRSFAEALAGLGSSGEYFLLGSVVNTFLESFSASSLRLTVEGEPLRTGHRVYDGALTLFAGNSPTP